MSRMGIIWIFANSHHPEQSLVVADTRQSPELDALDSVDTEAGWICVFSVAVTNVSSNLQALSRQLNLAQVDHIMDIPPVTVANALHKVVHGELTC